MLLLAVDYGTTEDVIALIDSEANVNEKTSYDGITALMSAAFYGRTEVVQKLIEVGAQLDEKNREGKTALSLAVLQGEKEVALMLIKAGANMDDQIPLLKAINDPRIDKVIADQKPKEKTTRPKSLVFKAEGKKEHSSDKENQKRTKKPKLNK